MNKYGEILEDGTLQFIRLLPGPIERVWAWITEPEKRALWFAGGVTASTPGGKVEFHFDHANLTPLDDPIPEKYREMESGVRFEGKVLAFEPPHLLRLSWPAQGGGEDTQVTFSLFEEGGRVRLELIHKGILKADDLKGAAAGWHTHLDIMAAKLSNDAPLPFWTRHQAFEKEYETRIAEALATLK